MGALGQMRHEMSRSARRVEGCGNLWSDLGDCLHDVAMLGHEKIVIRVIGLASLGLLVDSAFVTGLFVHFTFVVVLAGFDRPLAGFGRNLYCRKNSGKLVEIGCILRNLHGARVFHWLCCGSYVDTLCKYCYLVGILRKRTFVGAP